MIKIAVCDDSELDRELIIALLRQYFADKPRIMQIDSYDSGVSLLHEIEDGYGYDIIILDIYMDTLLGIDTARRLRDLHYAGEIIFLTATPEFAVESYDVKASGYLLKPHSYEKLSAVLDRVLAGFAINTYPIKFRNTITHIPFNEIMYVESSNTKCILHRKGGATYTIYKKLGDIEAELHDARFLRCHQSYLVNMSYIQHADSRFTLFNGETVMIRQRELKEIREKYLDYLRQMWGRRPQPRDISE